MNPARSFGPALVSGDFTALLGLRRRADRRRVDRRRLRVRAARSGGGPIGRAAGSGVLDAGSPGRRAASVGANRRGRVVPTRHRERAAKDDCMSPTAPHALDHVVLVLFENRSLDNLLGPPLRPRGRQDLRGRDRQGPQQPDPRVGRARRRAQGGARTRSRPTWTRPTRTRARSTSTPTPSSTTRSTSTTASRSARP